MHSGDTITSTGTVRPDIDDTFWAIVTGDDQWVRAEFDAIIDAGWDSPTPPPPPAPPQPGIPPPCPAKRSGSRLWADDPATPPRLCPRHQRSPPAQS